MKKLIPGCKVWFFKDSYEEILSIKNGVVTYRDNPERGDRVYTASSLSNYYGSGVPIKIQYPFKAYLDAI